MMKRENVMTTLEKDTTTYVGLFLHIYHQRKWREVKCILIHPYNISFLSKEYSQPRRGRGNFLRWRPLTHLQLVGPKLMHLWVFEHRSFAQHSERASVESQMVKRLRTKRNKRNVDFISGNWKKITKVVSILSDTFGQEQGSTLSVTLFSPTLDCSSYVDDFVFCYRWKRMRTIDHQMQQSLSKQKCGQ